MTVCNCVHCTAC